MQSELTYRFRNAVRQAEQVHGGRDRFIDAGIDLYVVKQDLKNGTEVIPGTAPVVATALHSFGGIIDTRLRQIVGPSKRPKVWHASERQLPLILHRDGPNKQLIYGAMGAGKTRGVLGPWLVLRALELVGRGQFEGGATAPTGDRTKAIADAIFELTRKNWRTYFKKDGLFLFRWGVGIRLITTTPKSAELGSPIQGWNWAFAASDELQDSIKANGDIEMRGRRAPSGIYKRLSTATAKDSSEWRTFRDRLKKNKNWSIARLEGPSNPFVHPIRWEEAKYEMSDREYDRKVRALDVGPERAEYPQWSRDKNLRPAPQLGRDVGLKVFGCAALLGHDPGTLQDVTLLLRVWDIDGKRNYWVMDEMTTPESTTDTHVAYVLERLQDKWGLQHLDDPDGPRVIVRMDPQGNSANRTDVSVYTTWRNRGFLTKSAAYTDKGKPTGVVPLVSGIEVVQGLLCSAAKEHRLFVHALEDGSPAAPMLVTAFESAEKDELGNYEVKRKGKPDYSHWTAALRYALWPYERRRAAEGIKQRGALF